MAKHIRNMDELQAALMPEIKNMMGVLTDRVYETLNHFLQEYYDSYEPKSYQRRYDFLCSAVKVEPKIVGNRVIASVYIDIYAMDDYYNATGKQVATWANKGLHGGQDLGNNTPHVWNDMMDETVNNGELLKLAVEYLREKGILVRV